MPSSREYLDFILDQLSGLEEITYRAMMKEYILYYRGKIFGSIHDDRLMIKKTETSEKYMPEMPQESPYPGAKPMIVADTDNRELLCKLIPEMYDELPAPKPKKKK